jgi:hypothetical protein
MVAMAAQEDLNTVLHFIVFPSFPFALAGMVHGMAACRRRLIDASN